ncbi:MAG: hypothetical protein IT581_23345 [Verrucomicrobiales bacterium]|nr:hypothetical protein [Verrucomicrobiales bacterium]
MSPRRKWLRRAVKAASILLVLLVLAWATMLGLMAQWVARPPALAERPPITRLTPEQHGDREVLGRSWRETRDGLTVLYLAGTPFEMGYANGVLTQRWIHRQEDSVLSLMRRVAPFRWTQFLLKFFVTYKNRNQLPHIHSDLQMEMFGIASGCPDLHPEMGPYFNRIVNYHGAQDISYMLMNSPLLRGGCTSFGVWGSRSAGAHLLTGRNFDWEADPVFDEDRMVIFCQPDRGIPFVSLAWAGMAGCVSGMNGAGVSVTLNGAPSHLPGSAATPTCLVAREVLQEAHTIAEAVDIIRRRQVFVSALFLVGSRADGKFVVVEKTPERMAVREPAPAEEEMVCANHYLTAELAADPINISYQTTDTSVARFERLTELLKEDGGGVDAARTASILRDRKLPGGDFAGNGHRSSLNPLIATHSVIMDLTDGILWASAPPHQLGRFIAFDVARPERRLPERSLPEDPILASGEHRRYRESLSKLAEGWHALKSGNAEKARTCAEEAERENPGFYQNAWLLAEAWWAGGDRDKTKEACARALAGKPAMGTERRKIEELAAKAAAAP